MQNQPFTSLSRDAAPVGVLSRARLWLLGGGVTLAFCLVAARIAYVQVVLPPRYLAPWSTLTQTDLPLPARDGRILTRDGAILAEDVVVYDVCVDYRWLEEPPRPEWLRSQARARLSPEQRRDRDARDRAEAEVLMEHDELLARISVVTGHSRAELRRSADKIQHAIESIRDTVEQRREQAALAADERGEGPVTPASAWQFFWEELTTPPARSLREPVVLKEELVDHRLVQNVPLDVAAQIQSRPAHFPGVRIQSTRQRRYPQRDCAAQLIGLRSSQSTPHAPQQLSGVERLHDERLQGQPGVMRRWASRAGEVQREEVLEPSRDGADVTLTIDLGLQRRAEQLLDTALQGSPWAQSTPPGGAIIVMDIFSGELLVFASAPRVAADVLQSPDAETWRQLTSDPRGPLFHRALQMALPPGALFRLTTAIAALERGVINPEETILCPGAPVNAAITEDARSLRSGCSAGHGTVNLAAAFQRDCPLYFSVVAERLGPQALLSWSRRLGLGRSTGVDLTGEAQGVLPTSSRSAGVARWTPAAVRQLAQGQGAVLVTPLQATRLMAALGNGGDLIAPRILLDAGAIDPALAGAGDLREKIDGRPETFDVIRAALANSGTGAAATAANQASRLKLCAGVSSFAKESSAMTPGWFAGWAPVERPRFAIVVALERAGGSEMEAVTLAQDLAEAMLRAGAIQAESALAEESAN